MSYLRVVGRGLVVETVTRAQRRRHLSYAMIQRAKEFMSAVLYAISRTQQK